MLKILVVDDSALMRRYIREIFEDAGDFNVATARNGREALEQIGTFKPAVVTLDVNMPEMDGLTCLRRIMRDWPCPVVMVSATTVAGSNEAIKAMAIGAVELVAKPDGMGKGAVGVMQAELLAKVQAAARVRQGGPVRLREAMREEQRAGQKRRAAAALSAAVRGTIGLTLIGVSTGGPRTLEDILPELPANYPNAVVIAQHMPAAFTASFAGRLNEICNMPVSEVNRRTPLAAGHIYIGRGDADIVVERRLGRLIADSVPSNAALWHPSVDRLVRSAMDALPAPALTGVQLTGMGDDGAEAMAALHAKGGRTVAESQETATVFGMPAELIRRGGATSVLPCDQIAELLVSWTVAEKNTWDC